MSTSSSKTVIYAALAGNLLIAFTKFAAALCTGSSAMMSEAVHSLVDTGNQVLLLYGMKRAAKPPSLNHPFGYGLQLYFWTFVVAVMIFGLGSVVSIVQGIDKIRHPVSIEHAGINYIVLSLSILFEGAVWWVAFKAFRAQKGSMNWFASIRFSKDPTLFTVLFEDSAALLGLIVALLGVFFSEALDIPMLDGIASVIIGCILAVIAFFLAYESQSLLTGEGVSPQVRASIQAIAASEPGVTRPNDVLTMHFGPHDVLVALSLDFDDQLPATDVETAVTNIQRRIRDQHPEATRIFVEAQSFEAHRRNQQLYLERTTQRDD